MRCLCCLLRPAAVVVMGLFHQVEVHPEAVLLPGSCLSKLLTDIFRVRLYLLILLIVAQSVLGMLGNLRERRMRPDLSLLMIPECRLLL